MAVPVAVPAPAVRWAAVRARPGPSGPVAVVVPRRAPPAVAAPTWAARAGAAPSPGQAPTPGAGAAAPRGGAGRRRPRRRGTARAPARRRRHAEPEGGGVGQLHRQRAASVGGEVRHADEERPDHAVLLGGQRRHVEGGDVRLEPVRRREAHGHGLVGRRGALAEDDGSGGQVAEALIAPGEDDAHEGDRAERGVDLEHPEDPADGGMAEPDGPALDRHDPQAQGGLAQRPAVPHRLHRHRVADDHQEDGEDAEDHRHGGAARARRGTRGRARPRAAPRTAA